jgi:hypothetical protein
MRLIISSIVYEMFLIIKQMIRKTKHKKAHKRQIDNIRLYLLKAGGTITKTMKRIYIKLSKAFVYKDLLHELAFQQKVQMNQLMASQGIGTPNCQKHPQINGIPITNHENWSKSILF